MLAILERLEAEYREAHGDGWNLHSEIVWHKPNPMPESVLSRPTSSHEKLFLLSKSSRPSYWVHEDGRGSRTKPNPDYKWLDAAGLRHSEFDGEVDKDCLPVGTEWTRRNRWRGRDYFYDAEAVRVPLAEALHSPGNKKLDQSRNDHDRMDKVWGTDSGANLRNVWRIPVHAYSGAHFATFPPALVEPCIRAGTSERGVCGACGAPWVRQVDKELRPDYEGRQHTKDAKSSQDENNSHASNRHRDGHLQGYYSTKTLGWNPSCTCEADLKPAIVLDPFGGAGTVALVSQRLGRKAICIEISPEYARMAQQRCERDLPVTRRPNREKPGDFRLEFTS